MIHVTLYDRKTRTILSAEQFEDRDEPTDRDPVTGRRGKVHVTAEVAAGTRANGLRLHAEVENAIGAEIEVIVGDAPFVPEAVQEAVPPEEPIPPEENIIQEENV